MVCDIEDYQNRPEEALQQVKRNSRALLFRATASEHSSFRGLILSYLLILTCHIKIYDRSRPSPYHPVILCRYFQCVCGRCCSPTEIGSHTNTLLCTSCSGGYLLPLHPLHQGQDWGCVCGHVVGGDQVRDTVHQYLLQVETLAIEDRFV